MTTTTETVQQYRKRLSDNKYRKESVNRVLHDRLDSIRANSVPINREEGTSLLFTLRWALDLSELVELELLTEFISQLARLLENAGAGILFRSEIDRAISIYERAGQSTIDLYLAKVDYLRLTDTESREKLRALEEARANAANPNELLRVLVKLAWYYIDSSEYELSIQTCELCQTLIEKDASQSSFLPKVLDMIGINHFYLFNLDTAKQYLDDACTLGIYHGDLHTVGEALHYLGRIAMAHGDPNSAMGKFIASAQHQLENLADQGWYHLRMSSLLLENGLLAQAKDHMNWAQDKFRQSQYEGSALAQIDLGWADVYKKEGRYHIAEEHLLSALRLCQTTYFHRGELLAQVKLFWLQLAYMYRIDKALITFVRAMMRREIRRNTGVQLIFQYLKQVLLIPYRKIRGIPYDVMGTSSYATAKVECCICPYHSRNK